MREIPESVAGQGFDDRRAERLGSPGMDDKGTPIRRVASRERDAGAGDVGEVSAMPFDHVKGVGLTGATAVGSPAAVLQRSGVTLQTSGRCLIPYCQLRFAGVDDPRGLWPQRPGDAPIHHRRCRGRPCWPAEIAGSSHLPGWSG